MFHPAKLALLILCAIFSFSFTPAGIDVEGYTYGTINLASPYFSSNLLSWGAIDLLRTSVGFNLFPNAFGFLATSLISLTLYSCGRTLFGFPWLTSFGLSLASLALPVCFLGAFNAYRQILSVIWFVALTYLLFEHPNVGIKELNVRRLIIVVMFLLGPLFHTSFFIVWFSVGLQFLVLRFSSLLSSLNIKKKWLLLWIAPLTIASTVSASIVLGVTLSTYLGSYDRQSFSGLAYLYLIPLIIQLMICFYRISVKSPSLGLYVICMCIGSLLLIQSPLNFQRLYFYPMTFLLFHIYSIPARGFVFLKPALALSPFALFFSYQYRIVLGIG